MEQNILWDGTVSPDFSLLGQCGSVDWYILYVPEESAASIFRVVEEECARSISTPTYTSAIV
jgi:hypothetical protein